MRWDIISAVLTFTSMLVVGQRKWQGWGLAFLNSVAVCILAVHVAPKQWARIPTNVFYLVITSGHKGISFPAANATEATARAIPPMAL